MSPKEVNEKGAKSAFSPDELEVLDVAYQSAWAKLKLRDPEKAEAVKDFLRQRVVQIAKYGVRDPETLSGLALDMVQKERRQSPGDPRRSKASPRRILRT